MKRHLADIVRRRELLLVKIQDQRMQISEIAQRWEKPLAVADMGVKVVRFLQTNYLLVAGVAALLAIRRRGITGLARGGWRLWRLYRSTLAFGSKFL